MAKDERDRERERHPDRAVYIISVAAELAGVHPQTLRIYERKGLVRPKRTAGNTRRYSQRDIERLQVIQELTQHGVNLAGVKMVMEMRAELEDLRRRARELEAELRRARRVRGIATRRVISMGPGERRRTAAAIVPLADVPSWPWLERG